MPKSDDFFNGQLLTSLIFKAYNAPASEFADVRIHIFREVVMDASIPSRADVVLGNLRVPADSLSVDDWFNVYDHILSDDRKKHLKHMCGSKPLEAQLNGDCEEAYGLKRRTDMARITWPEGKFPEAISPKTRCFELTSRYNGLNLIKLQPGFEHIAEVDEEMHIYMTIDGNFFLWRSKFEKDAKARVCLSGEVTRLSRNDLRLLILNLSGRHRNIGLYILIALESYSKEDLKIRRQQARAARGFRAVVRRVVSKLS